MAKSGQLVEALALVNTVVQRAPDWGDAYAARADLELRLAGADSEL